MDIMSNTVRKELIQLRRKFHQCAETGWLEFETSIYIIEFLKSQGLDLKYGKSIHGERIGLPSKLKMDAHKMQLTQMKVDFDTSEILEGYTGAVAILDTQRPGPTVALRFDIDALGLEEAKEGHRPFLEHFASKNKGMMHACGHDGHISMGLMLAKSLASQRDQLSGKIIFIFQPAEEGVRGAKSMVDAGILNNTDYILSGHIGFSKKNQVVCGTGGFLATSKLDISFTGKAAHAGAHPELGKNALLAGANCALNLHTLTQFGGGMSRLNVGILMSGTARNVVPDHAHLELETRGETQEINEDLLERVYRMIEASAHMYDVTYETKLMGSAPSYQFVSNEFTQHIKDIFGELDLEIIEGGSLGGSEDITYMLRTVEKKGGHGLFLLFGTDLVAPHHNPRFDFDETVLEQGYNCYMKIVTDLLEI